MGKKRKAEVDLDAEKTLYTSFVSAANTVSQLYTQAVQQQRKIGAAAARQSLERIICLILKEYHHTDHIPKGALLQYLQQEYEHTEGSEHAPQQYPAQFLHPISPGPSALPGSEAEQAYKAAQRAAGIAPSPARRVASGGHHHPPPSALAHLGGGGSQVDMMEQHSGMDATLSGGGGSGEAPQVQASPGFSFETSGGGAFGGPGSGGGHVFDGYHR